MHTVIKGTKTVAEFKEVQAKMEELATKAYAEHKTAFENWTYGEISKVWFDGEGVLCVEYDSGKWYHYRWSDDNQLTWW